MISALKGNLSTSIRKTYELRISAPFYRGGKLRLNHSPKVTQGRDSSPSVTSMSSGLNTRAVVPSHLSLSVLDACSVVSASWAGRVQFPQRLSFL